MITPLDIENKKFSKQMMNGYSVEEVDDFLDDLTVDYTKNYKEATELKAKVAELTKSLEHYKNIESTLQNTLVMAQKTADDVKNIAKQQADQIVNQAKGTAQKQANEAQKEVKELNQERVLMVQMMLKNGMSVSQIAKCVSKSEEEIMKWIS